MDMCDNTSRPTKMFVLIYGIFFVLCSGANGQNVTCNAVESDTTNVFASYNVNVHGATNYSLIYHPAEYSPNMRLPVDTTQVTVTAYSTSPSTEIGNCTFNVTVNLSELPIICPQSNDIEPTDAGESTFLYQIDILHSLPGFNYQSPSFPVIFALSTNTTGVVSHANNYLFPVGTHLVSVRYYDDYIDKVCNFTLTVVDSEAPTVSCPEDIIAYTTNVITYVPKGISDNVPDPTVLQESITYSPDTLSPGSRFPLGISTITISLTDGAGNQGNCSFDATVALPDLPIKCPPTMDLTVGTDPGQPFYTYPDSAPFNVTYPSESLTYVPYGNITVVRSYDGSMDGPSLDISLSTQRAYSVMVTISDGTLEKSCIEATVTVEDREPPAIVCPDDIFQTETTIDFNTFKLKSSIDNSGGLITLAIVPFATTVFPVGTTTYTFIATDRANNNASCSFNVTVELAPTSNSTQAPLTSTTQESTNTMESTTVAAGPQDMPDNLPIIISCSVAGVVLLLIIIILAVFCSSPGRRRIFGIGPKEPVRIRNVGASRHGVATDPVLLNDRLERTTSNLYASTNIDDDVESPEMTETDGATGGPKDMMDINGIHVNDAYTGET